MHFTLDVVIFPLLEARKLVPHDLNGGRGKILMTNERVKNS